MQTLYIESFSGLSGDMFLGALAGLAYAYNDIKNIPDLLGLQDAKIEISEVNKNGIVCNHVGVINLNEVNVHPKHKKHNSHRHLSDIIEIIDKASISTKAKQIAKDIFLIIGKSESKIHNIALEKIHFHEVSGVDSIIDIVGSAILIDQLSITKTYATSICTGFGLVKTQHGWLPVPAPATADILLNMPTYSGNEKGEKVTPTGAAILKYLMPEFAVPELIINRTAYGPGKKDFIAPNVLRLSVCETKTPSEKIFIIETNIDDITGEFVGEYFQNGLFKHGAIDFYFTQVQMKKGRPGILLSCMVNQSALKSLSDYVLENTTTIGIRYYPVNRIILSREIRELKTKFGNIRVKRVITPSGKVRFSLEYEDLIKIKIKENLSLHNLQNEILKELVWDE